MLKVFAENFGSQFGIKSKAPGVASRNPASDPIGRERQDAMQCQNCFRSQFDGAKLHRCSGCKIEFYCSRECQKEAWQGHKVKCKLNQRVALLEPEQRDSHTLLRAFCTKHRPTITVAAACALKLYQSPELSLTHVAQIHVYTRKASKRTETAFYAVEIDITPIDDFPKEMAEELKGQMATARAKCVKVGGEGLLYVLVQCLDTSVANMIGSGFTQETILEEYEENWKEVALKRLNEGIML
ncbi:hypothetical protein QCA50_011785 [Cerrena zonata]|uniref:MYND-type domain-containing protein n=1 Tax=Cerrena zonata TaxID=2478898 RepID=A0AAW0G1F6_9APHY